MKRENGKVESVGVGSPNPSERGNPAPTIAAHIGHRRIQLLPLALCLCTFASLSLNQDSSRITLAHVAPLGL